MSTLATTIDTTNHKGRTTDGNICLIKIGTSLNIWIFIRILDISSSGSKYMSIVIWSAACLHTYARNTNLTTTNSDSTLSSTLNATNRHTKSDTFMICFFRCHISCISKSIKRSHRAHGTTAIHIVYNITTINDDIGITFHDTSIEVVIRLFLCLTIFFNSSFISIRTATATIHISAVEITRTHILDAVIGYFFTRFNANGTTMNLHLCIMECMTILATTINRTLNQWL